MTGFGTPDRFDVRLAFLLEELDEPLEGRAEESAAELVAVGDVVIQPLLGRIESLGRLGQLCAIEIVEALRAAEAIPVLKRLLASEHETVREWASRALGGLGAQEAIPRLVNLLRESQRRGTPHIGQSPSLSDMPWRNSVSAT